MYTDYQKVRNFVWKFILEENINTLPIDIVALCKNKNIILRTYDEHRLKFLNSEIAMQTDGFTTVLMGRYFIFYNDEKPPPRIKFTIAHELGHIALNHVGRNKILKRYISAWNSENNEPGLKETEANIFASRLLAPMCILKELDVKSIDDVMKFTGLSREAAGYRFQRLQELKYRNKFYTHPLEGQVLAQFQDFIKQTDSF